MKTYIFPRLFVGLWSLDVEPLIPVCTPECALKLGYQMELRKLAGYFSQCQITRVKFRQMPRKTWGNGNFEVNYYVRVVGRYYYVDKDGYVLAGGPKLSRKHYLVSVMMDCSLGGPAVWRVTGVRNINKGNHETPSGRYIANIREDPYMRYGRIKEELGRVNRVSGKTREKLIKKLLRDFENEGGYQLSENEASQKQIEEVKNIFSVLHDPNLEEKIQAIQEGKEVEQQPTEEVQKPVKSAKPKEIWIYSASKDSSVEDLEEQQKVEQREKEKREKKEREERGEEEKGEEEEEKKEKKKKEVYKEIKPTKKKSSWRSWAIWESWWKP